MGELEEGIKESKKSLQMFKRLDPGSTRVADAYNDIATAQFKLGNLKTSLKHLHRARELYQVKKPNGINMSICLNSIGNNLRDMGDLTEALAYYQQALNVARRSPAPDSPNTATVLTNIGRLVEERGDEAGAAKYYEDALTIRMRMTHGEGCLMTANLLQAMANLTENKISGKSAELCTRAMELRQKHGPNDWLGRANDLETAGVTLSHYQPLQALIMLKKSLAIHRQHGPSIGHSRTARIIAELIAADDDQLLAEALPYYREAQKNTDQVLSQNSYLSSYYRQKSAIILWRIGRDKQACDELREVLKIDKRVRPETCSYDFFDFVGHTKLLILLTKWEQESIPHNHPDPHILAIDRFKKEAHKASIEGRRVLAFLYLRQATRIAHAHNTARVPELLTLQGKLYTEGSDVDVGRGWLRGYPEHAWVLQRQANGTAAPSNASSVAVVTADPPKLSHLHQALDALHVSFHELQCDYHISLAQHARLTPQDENRTAEFFVSFLNLLDKIYVHWIHAVLRAKGTNALKQHMFPSHGSLEAFKGAAREGKYWAEVHESMFSTIVASKDFVSLKLMNGLLEAGYLDKRKQWTATAESAGENFDAFPHNYIAFVPELKAMQERIKAGCQPEKSDFKRLLHCKHPLPPRRWVELLSAAGVCGAVQNSHGKLYADIGTNPLTLDGLLAVAKDAAECETIRYFYPQACNGIFVGEEEVRL